MEGQVHLQSDIVAYVIHSTWETEAEGLGVQGRPQQHKMS